MAHPLSNLALGYEATSIINVQGLLGFNQSVICGCASGYYGSINAQIKTSVQQW